MSDQYAINPYFLNAYNSPNFYGTYPQVATQPVVAPTNTPAVTPAETPAVKPKEKEEKSSSAAKYVLGAVALAGAALLCKKAYGMGKPGSGFWNQLGSGFKEMGASITNWGKGVKNKITNPEVFSMTTVGNETVCTIPGKQNRFSNYQIKDLARTGENINITEKVKEVGISTEPLQTLTNPKTSKLMDGVRLGRGEITLNTGDKIKIVNGKPFNSPINFEEATPEVRKNFQELLAKFNRGETGEGINLLSYAHTENGTTRIFRKGESGFNLSSVITDKHNLNSNAVKAYRNDHPAVDQIIKNFMETGNNDGLRIATANAPVTLGSDAGSLIIKNGEITGIKIGDRTIKKGTDEFGAKMHDFGEVINKALKDEKQYTDIVYHLA